MKIIAEPLFSINYCVHRENGEGLSVTACLQTRCSAKKVFQNFFFVGVIQFVISIDFRFVCGTSKERSFTSLEVYWKP